MARRMSDQDIILDYRMTVQLRAGARERAQHEPGNRGSFLS